MENILEVHELVVLCGSAQFVVWCRPVHGFQFRKELERWMVLCCVVLTGVGYDTLGTKLNELRYDLMARAVEVREMLVLGSRGFVEVLAAQRKGLQVIQLDRVERRLPAGRRHGRRQPAAAARTCARSIARRAQRTSALAALRCAMRKRRRPALRKRCAGDAPLSVRWSRLGAAASRLLLGVVVRRWWPDDAPLIGASSVVRRACRGRAWPCAARDFRSGGRRPAMLRRYRDG
ncbi:hypothetical protein F511_39025 [Dorcoceras hygrometricum]|uniref:Uncharacterized protein n=1 Tax=Dorcoceras hygrometricum TaxID=472368 RepID=A0A2Z7BZF9_9LAMI|nr:hypothetical protein F511_39025 [Dorcoceras hygrometricum]